jgi:hypothetical protein
MTRVRSKANPELVGTIISTTLPEGDVWVQWDDHEHPGQRWRIARDRVEEIPEKPEHNIHLSLLDAIDRLRDSMNLALECIERDIRREMKKEKS